MESLLKNIIVITIVISVILLCSVLLIIMPGNIGTAEETIGQEFAEIEISSLGASAADGATQNRDDGSFTVHNGGRIGFADIPQNAEISATVVFASAGQIGLTMRAVGTAIWPVNHQSWDNAGYSFIYFPSGQIGFYKNKTTIYEGWGSLPSFEIGKEYTFRMRTVNTESGVYISLTVNDTLVYEYNDTEATVITDGWFVMSAADGAEYSVKKPQEETAINPADITPSITSSNFTAAINSDGSVHTNATGVAGYSGVGYSFQTKNSYAIKTLFTPSAASGALSLTVGATKTNAHEMNRPGVTSIGPEGWGWDETGYYLEWYSNGQVFLHRQGKHFPRIWYDSDAYSANQTYNVEFGFDCLSKDAVRVYMKVNGRYLFSLLDRPSDGYTPYSITSSNTPGTQITTAMIMTINVAGKIEQPEKTAVTQATQLTNHLGNAQPGSGAITDKNGSVTSFSGGIVTGYSDVTADEIVSVVNFSSIDSNMVFMLRPQGSLDTPWGGGWTDKGYCIYIFPNGQIQLVKNGKTLCEGWAIGGFTFTPNTDYTVTVGAVNLSGGYVRIYAKINGITVLNYLDENGITDKGGYAVYSDGFSGSIKPYGVDIPQITASDDFLYSGNTTLFTCIPESEDTIYYIDREKSTGSGTFTDNIFTADKAGEVYVYAKSCGLYSDDYKITVKGKEAEITNVPPTALTAGGSPYKFEYDITFDEDVTSVEFDIVEEKSTGKAVMTHDGTFTPVDAGIVVITVTVNGVKSPEYTVYISPVIKIENTAAMAIGEVRESAGFYANCKLPDEEYEVIYELISGEEYVDMTREGKLTAKAIGIFYISVTIRGRTFEASSEAAGIQIEKPVVTLTGEDDIIIGESFSLNPRINDGVEVNSKTYDVFLGSDCIVIDGDTVTGIKAGEVAMKVTINSYSSTEIRFVVSEPVMTIICSPDMLVNSEQKLSVMLNSDTTTAENAVYSVVSGQDIVSVSGNILRSGSAPGTAVINATADNGYEASITVTVHGEVLLTGIYDGANVSIGSKIELSYVYNGVDEVVSVEYKIVGGAENAQLDGNVLTVTGEGPISVQVIVNGKESSIITLNAITDPIQNPDKLEGWEITLITLSAVCGAGVIVAGCVIYIRKRRKVQNDKNS